LLEQITTASFFTRVFHWREILHFTSAARAEYEELQQLFSKEKGFSIPVPGLDGLAENAISAGEEQKDVAHPGDLSDTACRDQDLAHPERVEVQNAISDSEKKDAIRESELTIMELHNEIMHHQCILSNLKDMISHLSAEKDSLLKNLQICSLELDQHIREQEEIETKLKSYQISVDESTEQFYELRFKHTCCNDTILNLHEKIEEITKEIKLSESRRCEFVKRCEGLTGELPNLEEHLFEQKRILDGLLKEGS